MEDLELHGLVDDISQLATLGKSFEIGREIPRDFWKNTIEPFLKRFYADVVKRIDEASAIPEPKQNNTVHVNTGYKHPEFVFGPKKLEPYPRQEHAERKESEWDKAVADGMVAYITTAHCDHNMATFYHVVKDGVCIHCKRYAPPNWKPIPTPEPRYEHVYSTDDLPAPIILPLRACCCTDPSCPVCHEEIQRKYSHPRGFCTCTDQSCPTCLEETQRNQRLPLGLRLGTRKFSRPDEPPPVSTLEARIAEAQEELKRKCPFPPKPNKVSQRIYGKVIM